MEDHDQRERCGQRRVRPRREQVTILSVVAHGATGTWLDEILEFGLPLVILIALYIWSSRKPRTKEKGK
jgi:hypothetical protein